MSRERAKGFAVAGLVGVLTLAGWESWLFTQPNSDPLIHSNHLSLYWVEEAWRWPLMFAAGAVGVAGLARLARLGNSLPLLWTMGCFAIGIAGAFGMELPLWWRFLLFAQLPVALGVAVWLADATRGVARRAVVATYAFTGVFKVATLLFLPVTITYFGSSLQGSYSPRSSDSARPGDGCRGPVHELLHPGGHRPQRSGGDKGARGVAGRVDVPPSEAIAFSIASTSARIGGAQRRRCTRQGVRYVLVQKQTSLEAPDLATFSTGPTPLIRTDADRKLLGTYFWRNNRVGKLLYDSPDYVLYRLSAKKLFGS